MKKVLTSIAMAAVFTLANSASATEAFSTTPSRFKELSECQLAQLAVCYKFTGNYVECFQQAQEYAC